MDPVAVGLLGCLLLGVLLLLGMPIAFLLMLVGFLGICQLASLGAALPVVAQTLYGVASHYPFTIIPLFIVMGSLAGTAGMTRELYASFDAWFRRLPGGLGVATIAACAGFAAVCGSSVAAAAAMGKVALPEMRRFGYAPRLATGIVAAGGTLSFLIPPSLGFVVYGMLTEQSIGRLFIAGVLPGLLLAVVYAGVVIFWVLIRPELAPAPVERVPMGKKVAALKGIWETGLVFILVVGGIYLGVINPTEAGAVGAFALFLIVLAKRRLDCKAAAAALREAAQVTVMVLFLVAGATVFSTFLALSTIPAAVSHWIAGLEVSRYAVLGIIVLIYILLGCFLDSVSMMVLTLPVVYPVVVSLGFHPIWFGVTAVLMMEAGLITPPMGLNVYTLAGIATETAPAEIFRGALPFLIAIVLTALLLTVFPGIA
ncbi:MAG: TRAP transporter large permease, partial [Desulfobacterales bacterium]|nr:TRAP transporter large permease [Desulfobacterales bacterium]